MFGSVTLEFGTVSAIMNGYQVTYFKFKVLVFNFLAGDSLSISSTSTFHFLLDSSHLLWSWEF